LQIRLQANAVSTSTRAQSCTSLAAKKKTRGFQALFIDLAGSERGIDAQNNQKDNRKEGAEINQSLLAVREFLDFYSFRHSAIPTRPNGSRHTVL
jgi:kinesin family protein 2/24